MANLLESLSGFALQHPSWIYLFIAFAALIQGEIATLLSTYLAETNHVSWFGFLATIFAAIMLEEVLLFFVGRGLSKKEAPPQRLTSRIPSLQEKIHSLVHGNLTRSLILAKFMWISRLVVLWNGYHKTSFKKFIKSSLISSAVWFTTIVTICYTLISTLTYRESKDSLAQKEIVILATILLIFGGELIIRKVLRKKLPSENCLYAKTEQFVTDAFSKANKPTDVSHAKRTAYWIKKLNPNANEALLIAGVAHDIEKAFYGDWKEGSSDPDTLKKHQDLCATEIEKFLTKENADKNLIKRVKHLIHHHEEGGDEDQDLLCDADCLAWFEEKALRNKKESKTQNTIEKMKQKLQYEFKRISSPKAKQIAEKWYTQALQELNQK